MLHQMRILTGISIIASSAKNHRHATMTPQIGKICEVITCHRGFVNDRPITKALQNQARCRKLSKRGRKGSSGKKKITYTFQPTCWGMKWPCEYLFHFILQPSAGAKNQLTQKWLRQKSIKWFPVSIKEIPTTVLVMNASRNDTLYSKDYGAFLNLKRTLKINTLFSVTDMWGLTS